MGKWIHAPFSLDGSYRMVNAERKIWEINIRQKYFKDVVDELLEKSIDLICNICSRNHHTKSGLINCLWFHKSDTINFYLDSLGGSQ
jgi:hypothetical protein